MDLLATLRRSGGIDALARQLGLPVPEVSAGAEAMLPAVLDSLRARTRRLGEGDSESGIQALLAIIEELGGGHLATQIMEPGPLPQDRIDKVAAQLLTEDDARLRQAGEATLAGGVGGALLARITPLLTMLVAGYIAARIDAHGLDGDNAGWLRKLLASDDNGESSQASTGTAN